MLPVKDYTFPVLKRARIRARGRARVRARVRGRARIRARIRARVRARARLRWPHPLMGKRLIGSTEPQKFPSPFRQLHRLVSTLNSPKGECTGW
jgi:hypothetical protein